eukprot:TRINITY_DN76048_c0_g1_i1.p1 TRINITY_DN76048_c0_g1~~TRINITY_DN76048_c0_g1_i1.p1  ORF type:complete len:414 (+),score=58.80 TRINITY_DN76048_c0_g1_i1:95-1336(+)
MNSGAAAAAYAAGKVTACPLTKALQARDAEALRPLLENVLRAEVVGTIRLEQTAGERFTGGKSTPVWRLSFIAARGEKRRETRLIVKWVRDLDDWRRHSYAVEHLFYLNAAQLLRRRGKCKFPHLLHSEASPSSDEYCFLLDDISVEYPLHPEALDVTFARAALGWLADFHACFWEADAGGSAFPSGLASNAGYWGMSHRDNAQRLEVLPSALTASQKSLKAHGAWDKVKMLGSRLAAAAPALDAVLRSHGSKKGFVRHRTLLHGDFKAANMFFKQPEVDGATGAVVAAGLDFEMCGLGLAAVDLVYLLFPDLRTNLLDHEQALLQFYHNALVDRLDELGVGDGGFSLPLLHAQYAIARCDYMRYLLGRGWTACSAGDASTVLAVEQDLSKLDGGAVLSHDRYEQAISDFLCA